MVSQEKLDEIELDAKEEVERAATEGAADGDPPCPEDEHCSGYTCGRGDDDDYDGECVHCECCDCHGCEYSRVA